MHDVAEKYYADASSSMERFRSLVNDKLEELMAELVAHKAAFDAEWVRRMRDFKGDAPPPEDRPLQKAETPMLFNGGADPHLSEDAKI